MKTGERPKQSGKEPQSAAQGTHWPVDQLLAIAREFLEQGGNVARRELVRTTLELDRLLREVRP